MGTLYVVGTGPGDEANMTIRARRCLAKANAIVGYTGYIERLRPLFPDQTYYDSGMKKETERVRLAVSLAKELEAVCLVSSGDAGIYGMAGLAYELADGGDGLSIEIVPGVTAAISGAALLGAPIGHDFAVISLSDLLTPWEDIEKRLRGAAAADFNLCLYNPGSMKRNDYLQKACDILLEVLPPERICGIARQIGRDGESFTITDLGTLRDTKTDMFETIFIGSAGTRQIGDHMVTMRGYKK